jgi:hypothetical protein
MFDCEYLSGSDKARLNFIDDEQDTMLIADSSQGLKARGRIGMKAPLPLAPAR